MVTIIILLVICVLVAYLVFRDVSNKPSVEWSGNLKMTKYNDGNVVIDYHLPYSYDQTAGNDKNIFTVTNTFPQILRTVVDAKLQVLSLTTDVTTFAVEHMWLVPESTDPSTQNITGFGLRLESAPVTTDTQIRCLVTARFTGTWR